MINWAYFLSVLTAYLEWGHLVEHTGVFGGPPASLVGLTGAPGVTVERWAKLRAPPAPKVLKVFTSPQGTQGVSGSTIQQVPVVLARLHVS